MNKFQKVTALISVLPVSVEKKYSYLKDLIPVVDNEKLLDYAIEKLIEKIDEEMKLVDNKKVAIDSEKDKINEIRTKLGSLSKYR
jgi:hypothetical protein